MLNLKFTHFFSCICTFLSSEDLFSSLIFFSLLTSFTFHFELLAVLFPKGNTNGKLSSHHIYLIRTLIFCSLCWLSTGFLLVFSLFPSLLPFSFEFQWSCCHSDHYYSLPNARNSFLSSRFGADGCLWFIRLSFSWPSGPFLCWFFNISLNGFLSTSWCPSPRFSSLVFYLKKHCLLTSFYGRPMGNVMALFCL